MATLTFRYSVGHIRLDEKRHGVRFTGGPRFVRWEPKGEWAILGIEAVFIVVIGACKNIILFVAMRPPTWNAKGADSLLDSTHTVTGSLLKDEIKKQSRYHQSRIYTDDIEED